MAGQTSVWCPKKLVSVCMYDVSANGVRWVIGGAAKFICMSAWFNVICAGKEKYEMEYNSGKKYTTRVMIKVGEWIGG